MSEQPHELLERAAAKLEGLASRATPGQWAAHDITDLQNERVWWIEREHEDNEGKVWGCVAELETVNPKHDARWIATMSPAVAAPLVVWMRTTARYIYRELGAVSSPENGKSFFEVKYGGAIAFAKQVLGEQ